MSPASLPAAAPPLEDDDLLSEIFLRLPPQPSSLPRARAVSRRWRSLASDPRFCVRFRADHRRNAPLLGCFVLDLCLINLKRALMEGRFEAALTEGRFQPALEAPNRLPEGRFTFPIPISPPADFRILGCRHGLLLIFHMRQDQLLVWDPVTGDQHRLDMPPVFRMNDYPFSGAVLRAAGDGDHFQVVLVRVCDGQQHAPARIIASVYSSNTGAWGNLVSTPAPINDYGGSMIYCRKHAVMIGNSLYWLCSGNPVEILEFDLHSWSLALIPTLPGEASDWDKFDPDILVIPAEGGGGVGFLSLSGCTARLWKRETDFDGVASWVLGRTIALDKLLSVDSDQRLSIIGLAENNNTVLLKKSTSIFTVHLESLESKKIFESVRRDSGPIYPFEGVYTADKGIDGGHDGPELVQNVQNDLSTWTWCRDILIEQVSRVGFWWLRCINGLFGVRR